MSDGFPYTNRQRNWWFANMEHASPYDRVMANKRDDDIQKMLEGTSFYKGVYFGTKEQMTKIAEHFGGATEVFKRSGFSYTAVRVNGVLLGPDESRKAGSLKRFR